MTLSSSRALLAALFAAAALSACSSKSNPPQSCTTVADCPSGDSCTGGECLAPGQCGTGILSCTDTAQCGSGNACTNGCCGPVEGCATNADCTTPTRPVCDASTHSCGACTSSTQCTTGKVCIVATGACDTSCTSDTNCAGTANPHCVTSGGYCAQCTQSSQCPSSAPTCVNNVCAGCTSNTMCSGVTPVCDTTTKTCVACLDANNANGKNASCPSATPACENSACVACNPADNSDAGTNGACVTATPSCGPASTCVACTNSGECTNGATCSSNACVALDLISFTSSASTVVEGGTATLTATLNGAVSSPVTINVAFDADGGSAGTLSAATIVISNGTSGTVTFTGGNSAGTALIDATLGSTTLTAQVNVSSSASADLASVQFTGASATEGGTDTATVTLTAAPTSDTTVAVSVDNGATINGAATANITVPAGSDVSAPFTVQLGCTATATTLTAVLGATTQTASITATGAVPPSVASVTAVPTPPSNAVTMGSPVTITATLTAASTCGDVRVSLASAIAFATTSKYSGFIPSSLTVPQGSTSGSIQAVPECSNSSSDLVTIVASTATAAGATPVVATTTVQVTPSSGLPAGGVVLCPISPVSADRTSTYLLADGGTAPLPVVIAAGFADYKPPTGTYTVSLSAQYADGGTCGTFTQDGGTITSLTMATPTKVDLSFLPAVGASGACSLYSQGMANPNDGGPIVTYDAGIVSTYNLINYDWSQQQTPTDLTLTKAEIDEDNVKIGTVFSDTTEYVEVFNGTASQVDLSLYTLVFVGSPFDQNNGTPTAKNEYWSYALSGMLQSNSYVIAQDNGTFASAPTPATTVLTWPDAGYAASVAAGLDGGTSGALRVGNIWNTPGGIFLVKNAGTVNATIVDAVTYGAPMQEATSFSITGVDGGVFSWPPSPLAPNDNWILDSSFVKPSGSLVRIGYTGSPALDWTDSTTVSPGAPNNVITGQ